MRQQAMTQERWTEVETATLGRSSGPVWTNGPAARPSVAAALGGTLRDEILPRLVLARRARPAAASPMEAGWSCETIGLCDLVLRRDAADASDFVAGLIASGMAVEDVYLDVLAPAARRLGILWAEDVRDIADVTLGLWRLREVMRDLGPGFRGQCDEVDSRRSILLVPVPGETHGFGLAMVADFLSRAGWGVSSPHATTRRTLGEQVHGTWFAIVGISVGCDASLDSLADLIRIVRRRSRNRAVGVMVGGPVFAVRPDLAAQIGADATALDGRHAVAQAQSLMALMDARA